MLNILKKKSFPLLLAFLVLTSTGVLIWYAYNHFLNADEREHLYASYLIMHHQLPYRDFFEHHHPLLWYLLAPFLPFFDNTPNVWYILRTIALAIVLGLAFFIYKLSFLTLKNKTHALISAITFLSFDFISATSAEFRPDSLMLLFFMMGLYAFLNYLSSFKSQKLHFAAMFFFLSFMTLQKIIFLLAAVLIAAVFVLRKNKAALNTLFQALFLPLMLFLFYIIYLYQTSSLKDYFELNWLLNARAPLKFDLISKDHWILPAISAALAAFLLAKEKNLPVKIISFLYLVAFGTTIPYAPSPQYILPLYPFLALIFSYTIFKKYPKYKPLFLLGLTLCQINALCKIPQYNMLKLSSFVDLSRIILSSSEPSDLILNSSLYSGGLRRSAWGYYWFGLEHIAKIDHILFNRHELPDLNKIIQTRRPKIIVNQSLTNCLNDKNQITLNCPVEQTIEPHPVLEGYLKSEFIYLRID